MPDLADADADPRITAPRAWARAARDWRPVERATWRLLTRRWKADGTGRLPTRLATWMLPLGGWAVTLAASAPVLGNAGSFALSLVVSAAVGVTTAWFCPPARITPLPPGDVPIGALVVIASDQFSITFSPIVAIHTDDVNNAGAYRFGCKNGQVYQSAADEGITRFAVVSRVDVFAGFRAQWREADPNDPSLELWLGECVETVVEVQQPDGPTLTPIAHVETIRSQLAQRGLDSADDALAVISLARTLGIVRNARSPSPAVTLTGAGIVWLRATRALAEAENAGDEGSGSQALGDETTSDIRHAIINDPALRAFGETLAPDQFAAWVRQVVDTFKKEVETGAGWGALWTPSGKPQNEKGVQAAFSLAVRPYCRLMDVDLTGESDAGNGPVDFKFSLGWQRRGIVEIKLLGSSAKYHGLEKQLPAYIAAEDVTYACYLCVGFTDSELSPASRAAIETRRAEVAKSTGVKIDAVIVDARRRKSASKL
ncbi:MAG: hypothetical protein PGN24_02120 [Microbacterium arborescens]